MGFCLKSTFVLTYLLKQERAKKIKKAVNKFTLLFLNFFEIAWLIYGNTFHYGAESLKCRDQNKELQSLWILMMIEIGLGYLVYLTCGILMGTVSLYLWFENRRNRREREVLQR